MRTIQLTPEDRDVRVRLFGARNKWRIAKRLDTATNRDACVMDSFTRHRAKLTPAERVRIGHLAIFGDDI